MMGAKFERKRVQIAGRIAALFLKEGVASMPLRDIAVRLGTSDRMLLYYFGAQVDLLGAVLAMISARLAEDLEQGLPTDPLPPVLLFQKLSALMARPAVSATLRVWADVAARGARDEPPFRDVAAGAVAAWLDWIAKRLDMRDPHTRRKTAAAMLAAIEGVRGLEMSAPGSTRGALPVLAKAFGSREA